PADKMRKALGGVGREVIDVIEAIARKEIGYQTLVRDASLDETGAGRNLVGKTAGKVVQDHNLVPDIQAATRYVAANETCAAGHQRAGAEFFWRWHSLMRSRGPAWRA